jgi:hypothetical protein
VIFPILCLVVLCLAILCLAVLRPAVLRPAVVGPAVVGPAVLGVAFRGVAFRGTAFLGAAVPCVAVPCVAVRVRLVSRLAVLLAALPLLLPGMARAAPIMIHFTAQVAGGNSIDTDDVFAEGAGANLRGQIITGSVTIDPAFLTQACGGVGACYGDFGAGAISVSFTLNGITSTVMSSGTIGYLGNRSGGSVSIRDRRHGGVNYLDAGATSADGMVQQSIGVLFNNATLFDAPGGDPADAIYSLGRIGGGKGLVKGGITYMSPVEHLDAVILSIEVPEPAALSLFGLGLLLLAAARPGRGAGWGPSPPGRTGAERHGCA